MGGFFSIVCLSTQPYERPPSVPSIFLYSKHPPLHLADGSGIAQNVKNWWLLARGKLVI